MTAAAVLVFASILSRRGHFVVAVADTCVLAAGFALFDAGLHPALLKCFTIGSPLDRSGELGALASTSRIKEIVATQQRRGAISIAGAGVAGYCVGAGLIRWQTFLRYIAFLF